MYQMVWRVGEANSKRVSERASLKVPLVQLLARFAGRGLVLRGLSSSYLTPHVSSMCTTLHIFHDRHAFAFALRYVYTWSAREYVVVWKVVDDPNFTPSVSMGCPRPTEDAQC